MLNKLRDQALHLISRSDSCTLATTGPAGLQASMVPCCVQHGTLYVFIPDSSDHLLNLEHCDQVVATTSQWELHGTAAPADPAAQQWHVQFVLTPKQIHVVLNGQHSGRMTIDL